jgi:aldehyde dehydrogenase (NAD+)
MSVPQMPESTSRMFIGGEWHSASRRLPLENPSTGEQIGEIAAGDSDDVDAAVNAARKALDGTWGALTAAERGRLLTSTGRAVVDEVESLAQIEALDVGKPLKQARADAVALARYLEFYGGAADKFHGETIPYLTDYTVYTLREPHGVTGHIIPWNYPMQIIGRSVVAALATGNAVVLKPAEEACLTALEFARIATDSGLPAGALNVVPGTGTEAGAALSAHPGVDHLSFTGSTEVGTAVQAAAADHVAPVTLELGGKSPQLVFDDADLDAALPFLVNAGIQNAGQTCSAGSRILVQRGIYDQVVEQLASRFSALQVGAAIDDLDVGPLICLLAVTTCRRPCSSARIPGMRWRSRKSSGPWSSLLPSIPRPRRSRSPTVQATDWWLASGRATVRGRCDWQENSGQARCSSTITALAAA